MKPRLVSLATLLIAASAAAAQTAAYRVTLNIGADSSFGVLPGCANGGVSPTAPVQTDHDFECFLNAFAAGCP